MATALGEHAATEALAARLVEKAMDEALERAMGSVEGGDSGSPTPSRRSMIPP